VAKLVQAERKTKFILVFPGRRLIYLKLTRKSVADKYFNIHPHKLRQNEIELVF
jgi:hypothetical protein